MEAPSVSDVLLVGTLTQIAVGILLAALLYWASREAGSRPYFRCWWYAFVALSVSLAALPIRYTLVRAGDGGSLEGALTQWPADLIYQGGKLAFFALLLSGAARYARRAPSPKVIWLWVAGVAGYAVVSLALSPTIGGLVSWQAAFAAPALGLAAYLLHTAPSPNRSLGTPLTGGLMLVLAAVWTFYLWLFLGAAPADFGGRLGLVLVTGAFFDALLYALLGIGMVVLLVEDRRHEAEVARQRHLREVEASEGRLARLLQRASDAILTLDDRGAIGLSNMAAESLFGRSGPELAGLAFTELVAEGDVAQVQDLLSAAGEAGARRVRVSGRRRSGGTFAVELTATRGSGADRLLLLARDVTEQAQQDASREALTAQLIRAQKLEAVGRLVSGVAHELNNPLAAILLTAEEALEGDGVVDAHRALTTVRDQVHRARSVVADLATLARGREGRRRPVTPTEILGPIQGALERELRRQGASLDLSGLQPCDGLVDADVSALQQAVTNLVLNAGTAAGEGGTVRLRSGSDPRSCWLEVVDDGPGIPGEVLPRMFDPFFTTRGPGQGSGLGLSVAQAIVLQHGGSLDAENLRPPAHGARFLVTLPLNSSSPLAVEPAPPAAPPGSARGTGFPRGEDAAGPRTVLVVDDEASVRESLRRIFARHGWVVDLAEDGAAALERLDAGVAPTIVVCDLKMPRMTGIELHDQIAAARPAVLSRTIFITGDTASHDAAAFVARTACRVLEKPFDLFALGRVVEEVLLS